MKIIEKLNFDEKGLIPAIVQDDKSMRVLTLCYMDKAALEKTLDTKLIHVFRRSKGRVMIKGETSKCVQHVKKIFMDCANNSLLFRVKQEKAACHEGYFSCYYSKINDSGEIVVDEERVFNPREVYK